jgi:hypothetical protein
MKSVSGKCDVCGRTFRRISRHVACSTEPSVREKKRAAQQKRVDVVREAIEAREDNLLPEVEKLAEQGVPLLEAILEYGQQHGIEEEHLASLVKKNRALKLRLECEARDLRLLVPESASA